MGKRSTFRRNSHDFYVTPLAAVLPLLPHLPDRAVFDEPCCGDGALLQHLFLQGRTCRSWSDIVPRMASADIRDARGISRCWGEMFITNPPWTREILHSIIDNLAGIAPTWLLLDADWAHTVQAAPYMAYCEKIVSVGRVKWIAGSKSTGKDNCCWYLFDKAGNGRREFFPRLAAGDRSNLAQRDLFDREAA